MRFWALLFIVLTISEINLSAAPVSDPESAFSSANAQFQEENYTQALTEYTDLFDAGYYSEEMLYRLAFIHEKTGSLPEAIFYLRKAAKEFGPRQTEEKVRALLRQQRVSRVFSGSSWDAYLAGFRAWSGFVYGVFGTGIALLLVWFLVPSHRLPAHRIILGTGIVLTGLTTAVLAHRLFMVPDRAVSIHPTSFYESPSYGAERISEAFSPGMTVYIEEEQDLWRLVSAGSRAYWVPRMVLREL